MKYCAENMNKKFLENKIILLGLGITQREIAKQLNMAESYVSLLMSGKRKNKDFDNLMSQYKTSSKGVF